MNLEQKIKEEMYNYVRKFDLTESEIKEIDTYVLQLLKSFSGIIKTHENIISDEEKVSMFKTAILNSIGS